MYKRKSKAERRRWWWSLTDDERYAYQQKKMAQKPKRTNFESSCTVFPVIDSSNRKEWQERILKLNDWLDPGIFEPQELDPAEQFHMNSIAQEIRSV